MVVSADFVIMKGIVFVCGYPDQAQILGNLISSSRQSIS